MTLSEIFQKVKTHLLRQRAKAENEATGVCSYRIDGLSCAVGCLLTDEAYHIRLEGNSVRCKEVSAALAQSGIPMNDASLNLLSDLQSVHDNEPVANWPKELNHIQRYYSL